MKFSNEKFPCEACNEVTTIYRPKFNRIFCLRHVRGFEVERNLNASMTKITEQLAADLLHQHQLKFSKKNIITIMGNTANKSLVELELD